MQGHEHAAKKEQQTTPTVQKRANLVDLKNLKTLQNQNVIVVVSNIGFDKAENEPWQVRGRHHPRRRAASRHRLVGGAHAKTL